MKKFRMLLLCIGLLILVAGCGEKKEDTAWIDESAAKISNELTDGQFVLDGVVYTFPMSLQPHRNYYMQRLLPSHQPH